MTSEYTRTGIRRSGDDYQDLVALDLIIEMLEHPTRYQWIRVEADEAGFLDDVVALRTDDTYVVRQVKFSAHPDQDDDNWSWKRLLVQREGKKKKLPSLLEKWISSFEELNAHKPIYEASLISNRRADPAIRAILSPDRLIDYGQLDNSTRENIVEQIGDENKVKKFFSNFRFYVDQPKLENLEKSLRIRFYRLGGDDKGWLNLKDELRSWVRNRNQPPPGGTITLPVIKSAALWYQLQSLPQNFEVPEDYVLPSVDFHESFTKELLALQNGCVVLKASPGVGKSTYLSYLFQHLSEKEVPVVRHHYFLSLSDRTVGRLDHTRVAESLMSDVQKSFSEALGATAKENPHFSKLGEWITACGQYFSRRGKNFVIIIDGLDHVWRDQKSVYELDKLFEYLLPAPQGIVVVIGTQPVDDLQLPSRLKREAPREHWYTLPFLDLNAVENWIRKHVDELDLPETQHGYSYFAEQLTNAFFNKSQGHPLHLRYTLKALQEQNTPVTVENIERLPGCPHQDITIYYEELWNCLPSEAHMILRLFAACRFAWPLNGIIECCSPQVLNLTQIYDALRQTKHLMVQDALGLRPFHSSILVFIADKPDYEMYSRSIKQLALNWLHTSAPDYWKWAYEWLLEAELGNEQLLIDGPNRQWVIEALVKGYPYEESTEILARSAWLALQKGNVARYIEVALIRDYFSDAISLIRLDILDNLFFSQVLINDDSYFQARLENEIQELAEIKLFLMSEFQFNRGNSAVVNKYFDELNGRLSRVDGDGNLLLKSISKLAAFATNIEPERIAEFYLENKDNISCNLVIKPSAEILRSSRLVTSLLKLSKTRLSPLELLMVNKHLVLLAIEEGFSLESEFLSKNTSYPFVAIYAKLRKINDFDFSGAQFPSIESVRTRRISSSRNEKCIEDIFENIFFGFFSNYLWNREGFNENWLAEIQYQTWLYDFFEQLNITAKKLATLLLEGSSIPFHLLYQSFENFDKENWHGYEDEYRYKYFMVRAINYIGLNLYLIVKSYFEEYKITKSELQLALSCTYFSLWDWLDVYLENRRKILNQEALHWLLQEQRNNLHNLIEEFEERADKYRKLASLSRLHELRHETQFFVYTTVSNLITYGRRKDLLLWHILDITRSCWSAGISEAKQWLLQVAPAIAKVRNFTDGDETGNLPRVIADVIAEVSPSLLPIYYQWLSSKEEYYDALRVFHTFLRTADLSYETNQALATTALDEDSLSILDSRAESGDRGARKALNFLLEFLGSDALDRQTANESQSNSSYRYSSEDRPLPLPSEFPPNRLKDYWVTVCQAGLPSREGINPWIDFWKNTDQAENALLAIEAEVRHGTDFRTYDEVFTLALAVYGKDYAYPWLVRAHISHYGWRYYYAREDAVKRWEFIKKDYPERWYNFILDTIKAPYGAPWREVSAQDLLVRLVDYCIFMGQTKLAKQISEQVISSTLELLSPLNLPTPEWINEA